MERERETTDYRGKYLKYKAKYLRLKSVRGGGTESQVIKLMGTKLRKATPQDLTPYTATHLSALVSLLSSLERTKTLNLADPDVRRELQDVGRIIGSMDYDRSLSQMFRENVQRLPQGDALVELLLGSSASIPMKECSVEELMTRADIVTTCKNLTKVFGSCSEPAFVDTIGKDLSDQVAQGLRTLFSTIVERLDQLDKDDKNKERRPTTLILDVGAHNESASKVPDSLILRFVTLPRAPLLETVVPQIAKEENLNNKVYTIQEHFPLDHNGTNTARVMDYIKDTVMPKIKIRIENKICGTCFRSFYYLVKHGAEYIVNPAQGAKPPMDTDEILRCFKGSKQ